MEEEKDKVQVIGDFNVRTGCKGDLYTGEENENTNKRVSKDKVVNLEGEQFLDMIETRGLQIANGNIKRDELGEFTYSDTRGASAIDYLLVNNIGLDRIDKFKVEDGTVSDHQPISATFKVTYRRGK